MPYRYRRRGYGRRRSRRVKPKMSGLQKAMYYGRLAWKGVKFLKGIVNAELHTHDNSAATTYDYNGTIYNLTAIAQGDDIGQRQGNSILLKQVYVRGFCNLGTTVNNVRIIIFQDMENTGSAPSASNLLQTIGSSQVINSPLNEDFTPRYRILSNKVYSMSDSGTQNVHFRVFKRVHFHVKYTGAADTDIYKNQVYMAVFGDTVTTGLPSVTWTSRVRFYDN